MSVIPRPAGERTPFGALAIIAIVACALRIAFGLGYWTGKPLTHDEQEYLSLARSLAAGHGFTYDATVATSKSFLPFGRAPGYPAFLAIVGGGHEPPPASVPARVKVAQAIVGAAGVWLVGLIAMRLGGSRAARAAALIAACYPPLVWIASYALSEAIFWPAGLVAAWLVDRAMADTRGDARGTSTALAGGLATGVGVLIRPALLLFVPLAVLWLLVRRRATLAIALLLGLAMLLVPWTIRNHARYGRFILVASDGGVTFWTGNHPLATGDGDMAANPALKIADEALRAAHPGLTEEEMEPIYYREAFAWIRAHPLDWMGLEARKLFYLVVPIGPSYFVHSRLYAMASIVSYGLVFLSALAGLARLGARVRRTPALWLLALSAVATCLVFFTQERFRIPVIDPVLVILAGTAWAPRVPRPPKAPRSTRSVTA